MLLSAGCRKEFLSQKPSSNLLIPNSLATLQELLDNTQVMNMSPALGEVSADNYFLPDNSWVNLDARDHNAYVWAADIFAGQGQDPDWDVPYQQVFYANTVLHALADIQPDSSNFLQWKMLKGWALFSRAFAFYNIAQLFAEPYRYDSLPAADDPGIPVRLSPDINDKTSRATIKASYDQILNDLYGAEALLPASIPVNNLNRPSQLAARALLARVYLSIRNYASAAASADSVLGRYSSLLDFDSVAAGATFPFADNMPEVLWQSNFPPTGNFLEAFVCSTCLVDTGLIKSYSPGDLRPTVLFHHRGADSFGLKGSYSGRVFPFSGLATDELYLIRAECRGRLGDSAGALADLNALLVHRFQPGTFNPYSDLGGARLLDIILAERRKELPFRGLRWSDLRRLNQEGRNITLTREINGQTFVLPPGSDLYTLPIPPDVIQFSGIRQNPR